MFTWIRRMFGKETPSSGISEYEAEQLERIHTLLRDNPDASNVMKMLAKDFEVRSLRQDSGGSSSSPLSSS